MSKPPTSLPPRKIFLDALSTGLLWGIAAAVALGTAIMAVLMCWYGPQVDYSYLLFSIVWTAGYALAFAVFPIGPIAVLLGWRLYRGGAAAPSSYAMVGAISACAAPVLILIALEARLPTIDWTTYRISGVDGVAIFAIACFPIIGAFGGYMAGRYIRRASASNQISDEV